MYEAQAILAKETTLRVRHLTDRENPLDNVPEWFLNNISKLEVEVDSFVHIQRGRLTGLQKVTLVNEAPGLSSSVDALDALDVYECVDDAIFTTAVMEDILSWEWKKEQYIYLAKEEEWGLTLKAQWYSFSLLEHNTYLVCSASYEASNTNTI